MATAGRVSDFGKFASLPLFPPAELPADDHLAVARRLAREFRRLPDAQARTTTGQQICHHLRAMLAATAVQRDLAAAPRH